MTPARSVHGSGVSAEVASAAVATTEALSGEPSTTVGSAAGSKHPRRGHKGAGREVRGDAGGEAKGQGTHRHRSPRKHQATGSTLMSAGVDTASQRTSPSAHARACRTHRAIPRSPAPPLSPAAMAATELRRGLEAAAMEAALKLAHQSVALAASPRRKPPVAASEPSTVTLGDAGALVPSASVGEREPLQGWEQDVGLSDTVSLGGEVWNPAGEEVVGAFQDLCAWEKVEAAGAEAEEEGGGGSLSEGVWKNTDAFEYTPHSEQQPCTANTSSLCSPEPSSIGGASVSQQGTSAPTSTRLSTPATPGFVVTSPVHPIYQGSPSPSSSPLSPKRPFKLYLAVPLPRTTTSPQRPQPVQAGAGAAGEADTDWLAAEASTTRLLYHSLPVSIRSMGEAAHFLNAPHILAASRAARVRTPLSRPGTGGLQPRYPHHPQPASALHTGDEDGTHSDATTPRRQRSCSLDGSIEGRGGSTGAGQAPGVQQVDMQRSWHQHAHQIPPHLHRSSHPPGAHRDTAGQAALQHATRPQHTTLQHQDPTSMPTTTAKTGISAAFASKHLAPSHLHHHFHHHSSLGHTPVTHTTTSVSLVGPSTPNPPSTIPQLPPITSPSSLRSSPTPLHPNNPSRLSAGAAPGERGLLSPPLPELGAYVDNVARILGGYTPGQFASHHHPTMAATAPGGHSCGKGSGTEGGHVAQPPSKLLAAALAARGASLGGVGGGPA